MQTSKENRTQLSILPTADKIVSHCQGAIRSKAREMFKDTDIKVTTTGKRHLGAVIGSQEYKSEYLNEMVHLGKDQLLLLSKIAEINPQAAYSCYVKRFQA